MLLVAGRRPIAVRSGWDRRSGFDRRGSVMYHPIRPVQVGADTR
jgi:hypothetical protein